MKSTFTLTALAAAAMAENDFELNRVQQNLKWIRPPSFGDNFSDVESFFKEKPTADGSKLDEKKDEALELFDDANFVDDNEGDYNVTEDGNNFVVDDSHHRGHSILGDYHS